jgi:PKD domain
MPDSIYWISGGFNDLTIRRAPLSGGAGGGTPETLYSGAADGVSMPYGLTIDAAAGRIYWTNRDDNTIRRAPLSGGNVETVYSGPAQAGAQPGGIAIHPAGGRIYWASTGDDTIRRAPLTVGGAVETLYTAAQGVMGPTGVAIDPAAGRIYWANVTDHTLRRAPLVGAAAGGTVDPPLYGPQGLAALWWMAIDPAAGRIYWTNWNHQSDGNGGRIQGAPLAGGGTVDTLYDSAHVRYPGGLAIDPNPAEPAPALLQVDRPDFQVSGELREAQRFSIATWFREFLNRPISRGSPARIYWGSGVTTAGHPVDNTIRGGPLAGGGSDTLYGPAQGVGGPAGLALLRTPLATAPPTVGWVFTLTGGGGPFFGDINSSGLLQQLGCSPGTWAPDLLGSFLYRAPQSISYQWRLNGTDIGGATSARYSPTAPGSYSCRVTASNGAGSATQTSAAFAVSSTMLPSP